MSYEQIPYRIFGYNAPLIQKCKKGGGRQIYSLRSLYESMAREKIEGFKHF